MSGTSWIGDVLLTFQVSEQTFPGRSGSNQWARVFNHQEANLWLQPASPSWHGIPYRAITGSDWQAWILGEMVAGPLMAEVEVSPDEDLVGLVAALPQCSGNFFAILHHTQTGQWHVLTNRFGTQHVYAASDGRRGAIGTFFPAVAAAASRRQLDWLGLAGFCTFGFFPQDRTYFEDVRILRPATHSVFEASGKLVSQQRYWRWQHHPDRQRSYEDTVAEFGRIFTEVMADNTREGRLALPISGGLDSRSTVAAITRPDDVNPPEPRFWAYSYGYDDASVETSIARQVAAARRLPFTAFTIKPYLFDRLEQVLASVEGFQDVTQCRQAAVGDELRQQADFVMAAHWGDVWLDDMGLVGKHLPLSESELIGYAFKKMAKGGHEWLLEHLCRPHLKNVDIKAALTEMVSQEMAAFAHLEEADFRIKAFKTDQWSYRWTEASLRMFQAAAFPRLPFYDNRIADFFCTVPSEFVAGRRLQIDYLKQFAPDLASIKWQVYDTNLYRYQHFHTWQVPKRALKKAWRLLSRQQVLERNWEVQFLNPGGRQGLAHWLLRPGAKIHDLVPPAEIDTLLQEFYQAPLKSGRGYAVCMLLTLAGWMESYW